MAHRIDLHVHSCYSRLDGMMSPRAIVKLANRLDYDGIAITDHYTYDGALRGAHATQHLAHGTDLTVWTGLEYHVKEGPHRGHILLYYEHTDQVPPRDLTLHELIDHAHDENLTLTHAHPYGYGGIQNLDLMHAADHIEINGSYGKGPVNDTVRTIAEQEGLEHKLLASSDAHARGQMGSAYTTTREVHGSIHDTLQTKTGYGLGTPRRSWGRAAKAVRMVMQPFGIAMNGIQRLATRWTLNKLPEPEPTPTVQEA